MDETALDEAQAVHEQKVAELASQVRGFYRRGEGFKVYHASTNSTRVLEFDRTRMVDTSGFDQVLRVDRDRKVVVVEANVSMDRLVDAVLPLGLVPKVVPEFPGITVAGGLQGGAGESSSFKWGGVHSTLNWFEMVLADGDVVQASPEEHADLFFGAAGAYGTLGVVAAAEVQLIDAAALVELELRVVHGFDEANAALAVAVREQPDFVDGIMFAADLGVIMVGRMVPKSDASLWRVARARDDWFYLQVLAAVRAGKTARVAMPLREYLFRYDRGGFWMGMYAFKRFGKPFNRFTRWLLDPLMHTRRMYSALQASGVSQEFVVQDLALPPKKAVEFMEWVDGEFKLYPLWLCPLLIDGFDRSPFVSRPLKDDQAVNVGVWGPVSHNLDAVEAANRRLEHTLTEMGGRKWLYAYAFYTEQEFWELYPRDWYDALRRKYHAEGLPTVYDKVCRHRRMPVMARRGVLTALLGRRGIRVR